MLEDFIPMLRRYPFGQAPLLHLVVTRQRDAEAFLYRLDSRLLEIAKHAVKIEAYPYHLAAASSSSQATIFSRLFRMWPDRQPSMLAWWEYMIPSSSSCRTSSRTSRPL